MNKETYLNELAQALKMYDKTYVDEIISDYDAHFEGGRQQGKSEEDICAELGSVSDVIAEIKELLGDEKLERFVPARPDAPIVHSGEGYSYKSGTQYAGQNGGETESRAYGGSAENKAYGDYDEKIVKSFRFQAGGADVRLRPARDGILRVYTEDKEDMQYIEQSLNNGVYSGRVVSKKGGFLGVNILFDIIGGTVGTVIAEIPATVENIKIEVKSGDVFLRGIRAEKMSVFTASGDVSVKKSESRNLEIQTASGDVELKKVNTEMLGIRTVSGDVRYEDVLANEFFCKTTSGDVGGKRIESRSAFVKTVSGEAALNLSCYDETFKAYAKSVSGSIKIKGGYRVEDKDFFNEDMENDIKVAVETVSGDIRIKAAK